MKCAIMCVITAVVVAVAVGALCRSGDSGLYLPEYDEYGARCEGDCDPDTPCQYCNPKR